MRKELLLWGACICFISCGNNEIKNAAYNYNYAMANYQFDEAEKYCTEETNTKILEMARYLVQFVDSAYIASDTPATIDITKVKQTSDTTAFAIYHKVTPIKDFSDTVQLRLRDGRWLVHDI